LSRIIRIGLILAIVISLLTASSGLFEDWLWFSDLGYTQLFWTPLISKWLVQAVNGTLLFVFIAGTLLSIRHAILTFVNDRLRMRLRLVHEMDRPVYHLSQRRMTVWLVVISALVSFGISFIVGFTGWLEVLSFVKYSPFGQGDPVFGKDLGFYVFQLPFLNTVYNAFFGPLFLLTLITALFYVFAGVIRLHSLRFWRANSIEVSSTACRHLSLLIAVLFLFKGFGFYLDMYQLLYSKHGQVFGAGFADLTATLPALKILIGLSLFGLISALATIVVREVRLVTLPILIVFIGSILLSGLWPELIQSFIVVPNELDKETPYIKNEIAMTRLGYGLNQIKEQDYSGKRPITVESLKGDQQTLKNIRLNDPRPMLQTYTQKQGIRLYYKFNDIDIDRYIINGEYRQVMLSPRELSSNDLDSKAKTFVNLRFKYTHGFGVTASFANAVTSEGLPAFAIKDVPSVTEFQEFRIIQPRIYFGELTNDWVVVDTEFKEFDYPLGNVNAETRYDGKTGISLTPLNRLMLSLKHGTLRFYLASEVTSQSRILLNRNIMERVEKLAPFLRYDEDPYMVIDNGRLKWIIDAFTVSNTLPYSTVNPDWNINYIRNSVKVVVDAYDGTVDFYSVDRTDPILLTYQKIFPGVFKDVSEMPKGLRAHLRYPETLFSLQSNMLKNYHMSDATVFYNKEDAWDIAKELFKGKAQNVDPYYTVMQIPGSQNPEFVLMLPFTPASSTTNTRNNMVAWMAARMDGEHYGELVLFKIPKNVEVDGPLQIESRIDQDPSISEQLALWDQKGSSVIRGNLLALPIGGNFLYVEPIYLQSDKGGSIPEMKRVVVAYENKLVMTETLGEALTSLFGPEAPQPSEPGGKGTAPPPTNLPPKSVHPPINLDNMGTLLENINQLRLMLDQLEDQLKIMQGETQLENLSETQDEVSQETKAGN
jgi:uncharacterized protein